MKFFIGLDFLCYLRMFQCLNFGSKDIEITAYTLHVWGLCAAICSSLITQLDLNVEMTCYTQTSLEF